MDFPKRFFFNFESNYLLESPLDNKSPLFHVMAWHQQALTHWGRVTHICVSKLTNIGSDNGLSPTRRQAIIWTNAGILLIRPSRTNFSEILIKIDVFSFKKMHLKMSSAKCRPFCLGLNVTTWTNAIKIQVTDTHMGHQGPSHKHGLTLIPAWISNYIHYKM